MKITCILLMVIGSILLIYGVTTFFIASHLVTRLQKINNPAWDEIDVMWNKVFFIVGGAFCWNLAAIFSKHVPEWN